MPLEMPMKSLISKHNMYERNKKISSIRCFCILFAAHIYGARCKHKYEYRVHTVVIAVRIIRVIKTHRNELESRKLSQVPAVGNFARFSRRCFLFLGTLSLSYTAVMPFLFALAEINRSYNKVSRWRNGEVSAAVNRRGESGAILSKNVSCEKERPDSVN